VFRGSSPITLTSPSWKACRKSGPFAPPALPGFITTMAPSDSRRRPPPDVTLRLLPRLRRVSLVTRTTMRACRAHYPGGSKRVHVSIASPSHAAFPILWVGRHPHCPFRGLLRLHSRYGPPDRSAAHGDLCREAPTRPVARPSRSPASGPSTTIRVEPSSTDDSRPRGALPPRTFFLPVLWARRIAWGNLVGAIKRVHSTRTQG
jgi:hypothetical protein